MKRVLALFMALCLIFGMCTGCRKKKPAYKIGLCAPESAGAWTEASLFYAEKYCTDNGLDYRLLTSSDADGMSSAMDELIAWGASAVVIWTAWDGADEAAEKGRDAGIPVVGFDSDIRGEGVCRVMHDYYDMGWLAAQYIAETVGDDASVALLTCPSLGSVSDLRREGFYACLREMGYDTSRVFEIRLDALSESAGAEGMRAVYDQHESVDAVYAMDDEVAVGVLQFLHETGRTDVSAVVGGGGKQTFLQRIGDSAYAGYNPATTLCSPSGVQDAIRAALRLCQGVETSDSIRIPTAIVHAANVAAYTDPNNLVY